MATNDHMLLNLMSLLGFSPLLPLLSLSPPSLLITVLFALTSFLERNHGVLQVTGQRFRSGLRTENPPTSTSYLLTIILTLFGMPYIYTLDGEKYVDAGSTIPICAG